MFELGDDTATSPANSGTGRAGGAGPGRPFPQGWRDLRMNKNGVLGLCTGIGTAKAAASVMALGLDPRFDLGAGPTGWSPASPGSIRKMSPLVPRSGLSGSSTAISDMRSMRARSSGWETGYIPLCKTTPHEPPRREPDEGEAYHLSRASSTGHSGSRRTSRSTTTPPCASSARNTAVTKPHTDAATGAQGRHAVRRHVLARPQDERMGQQLGEYHTGGRGNYVTTAMEDTGTMQALTFLDADGRVDKRRVLVLRTGSTSINSATESRLPRASPRRRSAASWGRLPARHRRCAPCGRCRCQAPRGRVVAISRSDAGVSAVRQRQVVLSGDPNARRTPSPSSAGDFVQVEPRRRASDPRRACAPRNARWRTRECGRRGSRTWRRAGGPWPRADGRGPRALLADPAGVHGNGRRHLGQVNPSGSQCHADPLFGREGQPQPSERMQCDKLKEVAADTRIASRASARARRWRARRPIRRVSP